MSAPTLSTTILELRSWPVWSDISTALLAAGLDPATTLWRVERMEQEGTLGKLKGIGERRRARITMLIALALERHGSMPPSGGWEGWEA